jgi:Ca-activated chloride channel family protein
MVVSFDSVAELVSDLTDSTDQLGKAIRNLRPGGGTSLYDAIYFACKEKLMGEQPRDKFRRARSSDGSRAISQPRFRVA